MFLYVELVPSEDGNFYDVKTAFPTRRVFLKRKTLLWEKSVSSVQKSEKERAPTNQFFDEESHRAKLTGISDDKIIPQSAKNTSEISKKYQKISASPSDGAKVGSATGFAAGVHPMQALIDIEHAEPARFEKIASTLRKAVAGPRAFKSIRAKPSGTADLRLVFKHFDAASVEKALRNLSFGLGGPSKSAKGEGFVVTAQGNLTDKHAGELSKLVQGVYDFAIGYFGLSKVCWSGRRLHSFAPALWLCSGCAYSFIVDTTSLSSHLVVKNPHFQHGSRHLHLLHEMCSHGIHAIPPALLPLLAILTPRVLFAFAVHGVASRCGQSVPVSSSSSGSVPENLKIASYSLLPGVITSASESSTSTKSGKPLAENSFVSNVQSSLPLYSPSFVAKS